MANLQIDALGEVITIGVDEDEEYLKRVLGYYKRIVNRISERGGLNGNLQVAILAGVVLCEELYKEKTKNAKLRSVGTFGTTNTGENESENDDETERIANSIIEKINLALE